MSTAASAGEIPVKGSPKPADSGEIPQKLSTPVSGNGSRWVAVGRFCKEVTGSTDRVLFSGRVLAKEPCAALGFWFRCSRC
jgi:hypothetical protein